MHLPTVPLEAPGYGPGEGAAGMAMAMAGGGGGGGPGEHASDTSPLSRPGSRSNASEASLLQVRLTRHMQSYQLTWHGGAPSPG